MRQSKLFTKTLKTAPKDETSTNARLLIRAGYVDKLMAGVYTYLPLGLRVLNKIKNIVREEMDAIGGQEILMPALMPKEPWAITGRWVKPGDEVMFQFKGRGDKEFGLGWTHEEIVTPLVKKFIRSAKDLPITVYQIQDKFRNEPRAKSGLLRGREFSMKDLYSFHADEASLEKYYDLMNKVYLKIFKRCGLDALVTEASGGAFSQYSHEYQVLTPAGEDTIYYCGTCHYAQNKEISIYKENDPCPKCSGIIKEGRAIEVGNIFKLKTKFTQAFNLTFADDDQKQKLAVMGCYGIGPSRVLGAVVEVRHDEAGLTWPREIAPFLTQLTTIGGKDDKINAKINKQAEELYQILQKQGIEVLYDDRIGLSAGEKLAEADLLGLPYRVIISAKTIEKNAVELKKRTAKTAESLTAKQLINLLAKDIE